MSILEIKNLTKSYTKNQRVIDGLSISFEGGKIIGLLGPNGSGKTTLLKLVAGLLTPDEGEILVCGRPAGEETNELVSFLPERTYFCGSETVKELIKLFSDFYTDFDKVRAERMLEDLKIDISKPLKHFSKGEKEKIQLVLVMARRAKLYLLDEPIGGVDPVSRDYVLSTIVENYAKDACVIITTHLIHDIEPVLDEFVFFSYGGKILLQGNADDARAEHGCSIDDLFREVYK